MTIKAKMMKKARAAKKSATEANPCPYCGRKATVASTADVAFRDRQWRVMCLNNVCRVSPESDFFSTKATALAWWNFDRAKKP